jgi:hypothetical protein
MMPARDQALLLLHQRPGWVSEKDLTACVEYKSQAMFRSRILDPLHSGRLIEYDKTSGQAKISPRGTKDVEERILKSRKL